MRVDAVLEIQTFAGFQTDATDMCCAVPNADCPHNAQKSVSCEMVRYGVYRSVK